MYSEHSGRVQLLHLHGRDQVCALVSTLLQHLLSGMYTGMSRMYTGMSGMYTGMSGMYTGMAGM